MLRHVAWFNEALVEPRPEGGLTSGDRTVCRRCLAPARELERLGVRCSVFGNLQDADPDQVSLHLEKLHTDIVVIGKFAESSLLPLAYAAKHLGCYVVADIDEDDMFSPDLIELLGMADEIVATNVDVAIEIRELTGRTAIIIPDCDERDEGPLSPMSIARLWLDEFKKLKIKPPACANTNLPEAL